MDQQIGDQLDLILDKTEKVFGQLSDEKKKIAEGFLLDFVSELETRLTDLLESDIRDLDGS